MKTFLQQKLLIPMLLFNLFVSVVGWGQSTVTVGTLPSATYTGVPTGVTFSAIQRGSGASTGSASGSISGAGFNTASPEASYSAQKYYTFNITAGPNHNFNLTQIVWSTQLSGTASGTKFTVKTVNNNGAATNFGTASQSNTTTNTFTGSVNVLAGTVLKVYLIPSNASADTGTVRVKDGSTFRLTVTSAAVAPSITSGLTDSSTFGNADTYSITASGSPTSFSAVQTGQPSLPTGATINTSTGVISFANTFPGGSYSISITASNSTGSDTEILTYTRNKANQSITFLPDPLPVKTVGDAAFNLSSTASSGLTVSYESSNPAVASVSGNVVTVVSNGTANITASQSGNTNYNPASNVVRSLTVNAAPSLSVSPDSFTGLTYLQGAGPSAVSQLTNITAGNLSPVSGSLSISVTSGATDFEVSNVSNSGFGTATNYSYATASFNTNNPAIYVRLKSGLAVGTYLGTITISGGGATDSFTVSGEVEEAATMLTTEMSYGPFCNDSPQLLSVGYTPQGTFDNNNFYVQLSDADGNFSNNFSNIIGFPNGGTSPINATINSNMPAGNYRVRVLQVSNSFVPTFSTTDNGSDIEINAVPTLTQISQLGPVCSGNNADIQLSGLLPDVPFTVYYTINNGSGQTATVTADETGTGIFNVPLAYANNGQTLTVTGLTRTDKNPACTKSFNLQATLSVVQKPTITGINIAAACAGEIVNAIVSGLIPGSVSDVTYTLDGTSPTTTEIVADNSGNGTFDFVPTALNHMQTMSVTSITRKDLLPNCSSVISGVEEILTVYTRPTAVISPMETSVCLGNTLQLSIELTGLQPWSLTYSDGSTAVTVNNIASSPYVFDITPTASKTYTVTSLNDAQCTALPEDISANATVNVTPNTWLGTASTDWGNPANWSCGTVPEEQNPVSISAVSNKPIISGNTNVRINSLTMPGNSGLTVETGSNLHVTNSINANSTALLVLKNDANLTQSGNQNTNNGPITVNRDALLRRLDYVYWSAPVEGQNLKQFSPLTLSNRFYTLTETTNSFTSINPEAAVFEPAKGYMIRSSNFLPPNGSQEIVHSAFTGKPNNGDISIEVTNNSGGINMIGNPYPSTIDADLFLNENTDITTLYFWTHMSQEGGGVNYATYNATGPTNTPAPSGSNPVSEMPNGTIQTGQGFLVKTTAAGMVNFNNQMRVNNNDGQFFRGIPAIEKHRIWLRFANENGNQNQIMVGYVPNATNALDPKYDGELIEKQGSKLYSVLNNSAYVIQGRALPFDNGDTVALGFTAAAPGNYSITLDKVDGLFDGNQHIFLKDESTGIVHNIKDSPYGFASEQGTFNSRFKIVYQNTTLGTDAPTLNQEAIIYRDNATLHVNMPNSIMKNVAIYDIRGRLVFEKKNVMASGLNIYKPVSGHQVLIVRITTDDAVTITKKVAY